VDLAADLDRARGALGVVGTGSVYGAAPGAEPQPSARQVTGRARHATLSGALRARTEPLAQARWVVRPAGPAPLQLKLRRLKIDQHLGWKIAPVGVYFDRRNRGERSCQVRGSTG
jgi:hypothetical protein